MCKWVQGVAAAQNSLGIMLEEGLGTIKDPDQALEWYEKAAKKVCTRLVPW